MGPQEIYRGIGGIGVPDSPSLMFTTNVDCIACHRKTEESQAALHTTKYAERAVEEACVDCHGEGFDQTLRHWKAFLSRTETETYQRVSNAQRALYEFEKTAGRNAPFRKAQSLINEARHNYSFVLLGRGVHNIEYAVKLLNIASNKTEQALSVIEKDYKPQELQTQITCTTLCHVGIERRRVPFNDIQFAHGSHVGNGLKCSDCHSARQNHGKTNLQICAKCHHGKQIKKVSCENCHINVKRLVEGKGGLGVQEKPSVKLDKVQCLDCHSGVAAKKKEAFDVVQKRCVECHDKSYGDTAAQWLSKSEQWLKQTAEKMKQVKAEIDRIELRGGHTFVYRKLYGDAEFNYNIVKKGSGVHNLDYADELLQYANKRLDEALNQLARTKKEVSEGKIQ